MFSLQFGDFNRFDDDVVDRTILGAGRDAIEFVHNLLGISIGDFTKDGVAVL